LGLRQGMFTCIEWQVTLYAFIWQALLRSSEMELLIFLIYCYYYHYHYYHYYYCC